jgi:hypothetical protein
MLGNSWVAAQLAASQEGLSSMKLINLVNGHSDGKCYCTLYISLSPCPDVRKCQTRSLHDFFLKVMPCSPLKVNQRFGGTNRFYLRSRRISQIKDEHGTCSKRALLHIGLLLGLSFGSENWGNMFLRNVDWLSVDCMALYPRLYDFITAAVSTSDPTCTVFLYEVRFGRRDIWPWY